MQVTFSEDLFAVCLLLAGGDTGKCIEEVIVLVEKYQLENDRHFGIARDDFRSLFYQLGVDLEVITYDDILKGGVQKILMGIPLQSWISNILEYEDTYFNDEGGNWCKSETGEVSPRNQLMRVFFGSCTNPASGEVMDFLLKNGFSRNLLEDCSRPGESS